MLDKQKSSCFYLIAYALILISGSFFHVIILIRVYCLGLLVTQFVYVIGSSIFFSYMSLYNTYK